MPGVHASAQAHCRAVQGLAGGGTPIHPDAAVRERQPGAPHPAGGERGCLGACCCCCCPAVALTCAVPAGQAHRASGLAGAVAGITGWASCTRDCLSCCVCGGEGADCASVQGLHMLHMHQVLHLVSGIGLCTSSAEPSYQHSLTPVGCMQDIKPDNLFLDDGHYRIGDFGLAITRFAKVCALCMLDPCLLLVGMEDVWEPVHQRTRLHMPCRSGRRAMGTMWPPSCCRALHPPPQPTSSPWGPRCTSA